MVIGTTTATEPARERPRQAVILAGGRGERMRPLTDDRPKAMIEFHGRPFLAYMIEMLRDAGFESVLLLLGYKAEVIQDYFGDGSDFGIQIEYSVSAPEDLTVRRMQLARHRIEDSFMLLYCDNYWPMRIDHMWSHYQAVGKPAMITVYRNADGYSKDSVKVNACGKVDVFDRSRTTPGLKGVEISYAFLTRAALDLMPADDELFEAAVYPKLVDAGLLSAYVTEHRYYSVGSLHRLPSTEEFLARKPIALLDRDGVLNKKPPRAEYVRSWEEFEWLPGVKTALAQLKSAGYRLIVISNQAGVARGAMTQEDLDGIHRRMLSEAAEAGGEIDAIYCCTHGWQDGCECRKPRAGLLFQAQREHHFDLTRAMFIGDDERDAAAADLAGCGFLRATERTGLLEITENLLGVRGRQLSCAHSN